MTLDCCFSRRETYKGDPVYDARFSRLERQSFILHPEQPNVKCNWNLLAMGDLQGMTRAVDEHLESIERCQSKLDALTKDFESQQARSIENEGNMLESMSENKRREFLETRARLDVLLLEKDVLLDRFSEMKKTSKPKPPDPLHYGPRGHGRIRHGCLAEIDGQLVAQSSFGLVIDDERSPYDSMLVQDYRVHVVKPFLASQNHAFEMGTDGHMHPCSRGHKAVPREKLPPWPQNVSKCAKGVVSCGEELS